MITKEISRDEWASFFDEFSRQHEGWLVTLEVLKGEGGAQLAASELPLVGITTDAGGNSITITVDKTDGNQITQTIDAPTHVWLEETEGGAHQALEVESAKGEKVILRFRSAVLPEFVDGVVTEPASV